jgi:urease accessory protein
MQSVAEQSLSLDQVGRRGMLSCVFARQGQRTVLTDSFCSTPWHYVPPSYLDETGAACFWLVNPCGGLVGADCMTVEARIEAGAHVAMTSPSANRIYRTLNEPAVQNVRLSVGSGARLEWVPELTIPFAGSRLRQSIQVNLAAGATALVWDAIASGRIARDERWAFASYENEIRLVTASSQAIVERSRIEPAESARGSLAMEWDYVASAFVVGDQIQPDVWAALEGELAATMDRWPGVVLGGVSQPVTPGLVIKVLARSAPDLTVVMEEVWRLVRFHLWRLPSVQLRRY